MKTTIDRRSLLAAGVAAAGLPASIARARAIDAHVRAGTIQDVEHVVILMQENRSFDHYFGALNGVRGFADRFPIPLPQGRTVWTQANAPGPNRPPLVAPFPLNTTQTFAHMRVEGTPHNWTDAQAAWDEGRMSRWPAAKGEHSMGYYGPEDLPFQYALADAFTVCDAYHCSMQVGTNSNRLFLFTGTNDPLGKGGGPSLTNSHDSLASEGGAKDGYTWTTYLERLTAAGVSWRVYQDMADNFDDNPLEGFKTFRDAHAGAPGCDPTLKRDGLSTYRLDRLKADVLAGALPKVSHIVAPQADSEHPMPSSPAQGAAFTAQVIDALTADPEVWARTVLLVMFDENDGFFDHVPPPAPPSRDPAGKLIGGSTVDLTGEHHLVKPAATEALVDRPEYRGRPYGLGPRVPMYVVSPWSRGGWVSSEVFDHTSVIRFLEARFGVAEPNISPWRRAVCGDLTGAFDFRTPNRERTPRLPATAATAARAAALPGRTRPPTPSLPRPPVQAPGVRRSRALPYELEVRDEIAPDAIQLSLGNAGRSAAVLHVYDLLDLAATPRRYTVGPTAFLEDRWPLREGRCDLWVLGPGGFHRRIRGAAGGLLTPELVYDRLNRRLVLSVRNGGDAPAIVRVSSEAYPLAPWATTLAPGALATHRWSLAATQDWYDLSVTVAGQPDWLRRMAGRFERNRDGFTDPAMHGPATMTWA